jgi:hypothetical protein
LEDIPRYFKRVSTNISLMRMANDNNETMMNVDENMDDLKHYAGTTCILDP